MNFVFFYMDGFCITIDELCIKMDGLCITIDELCIKLEDCVLQ